MLTEQQVSHFNTFGFLIFRQFFKPDEMKTINAEVESRLASTKRFTAPDDAPAYMSWPNLGPDTPFLAGLPEDPRICGTAEQTVWRRCDWPLLQCRQLRESNPLAPRCQ